MKDRQRPSAPGEPAVVPAVLPGPVAAAVLNELGQVRALWLLARRRTHTENLGDVTISYAAGRGSVYAMVVLVCLIELVAVHLIVPWHRLGAWSWLQWLALALSAYAIVWVVAWWAAGRPTPTPTSLPPTSWSCATEASRRCGHH